MITGMEIAACQHMAVPAEVMQHVVNVESGYNRFAIGVVGGQLVRQPQNLGEAIATVQMLDSKGYNFSLGLAQVNRANLSKYGLTTYQQAFDICPNLTAGARILSECYASSGNDWGKSFSCYYSGNFITGYRDGYVQKIYNSINGTSKSVGTDMPSAAIPLETVAGVSPSSLHGYVSGVTPVAAKDDASYRLAIRSTVLDTAAAMATKSLAGAISPANELPPSSAAPPSPSDPVNGIASANGAPVQPNLPPANTSTADVFEPQVRVLGEAPQASPSDAVNSGDQSQAAAATKPSGATADGADLRQGGQDSAFVF